MQTVLVESPAVDLLAAVERAVPGWVQRSVREVARRAGRAVDPALEAEAQAAGERARAAVAAELGALLNTDVDAQRSNPLTVLRNATRFPTSVLRAAGVPPARRDAVAVRMFPDDVYDLCPAGWADVDPALVEPGVVWGAWKAATVLDRRRREGRR